MTEGQPFDQSPSFSSVSETHVETHTAAPPSTKKKKPLPIKVKNPIMTGVFLILIAGLVAIGYMYYKTRQQLKQLSTPEGQRVVAQAEVKDIVGRLGKLTLLPNEDPVVATILDSKYLATQSAFYKDAQNGDKLVVYPKAQKAFIYSPDRNIIVNAGPLIVDQSQNKSQQQVRVEIRNGSSSTGAGIKMKQQLAAQGVNVTTVGDAANKDYFQTLVIPVNSSLNRDSLTQFAEKLGGVVQDKLPVSEPASTADVVIIIGGSSAPAQVSSSPTASPKP